MVSPSSTASEASQAASPGREGTVRRRPGASSRLRAGAPGSSTPLTGRGGIVVIFAVGLLGALLARFPGFGLLTGVGFVVGCLLAALATRAADLLTLVVSPPLAFFLVIMISELLAALGTESAWRSLIVGLMTTLASTAPWLFLGTALVLGIAIPRGLLANIRELRRRLAGLRLFHEEENADPVRWDESPRRDRRLPHGDVD